MGGFELRAMARIGIYIGRHLCTAPRAAKEADALAAAGHDVAVHGLWFDPGLVARDKSLLASRSWRFEPYADCTPTSTGTRFRWSIVRARARLAREVERRIGLVRPDSLGYAPTWMLAHARRQRADLTIVHSEAGLWVGHQLHAAGLKVGVDFEDWYSRDLPALQRSDGYRIRLTQLETQAVNFGPYLTAPSEAMASALADAYGARPSVIYNTFPESGATTTAAVNDPVSLHWFSQTLGPGRGLELLFAALPRLDGNWRLVLRADDPSAYSISLLRMVPQSLHGRIGFVPSVANADLPHQITSHDIGLSLETHRVPNKNLTIGNKVFQYLQGGLALVATETAGHREVLGSAPGIGALFSESAPDTMATALNTLITNRARLSDCKRAARQAATSVFAHERQRSLYPALADRALHAS